MKRNVRSAVTEALELPKESVLDIPLITFVGREEVILENYKGIIEYSEETVRINTGAGVVCLEGRNLILKSITAESITVKGTVFSLVFKV